MMKRASAYIVLFLLLALRPVTAFACPDINGLVDINCDGKLQITGFGDSITFGRGDSEGLGYLGRLTLIFPNIVTVNLGVPGEHTFRGRPRAAKSFPLYPDSDYAIILEGVNDYWLDDPDAGQTRSNLLKMISYAQNSGAVTLLANLTDIRRAEQKYWIQTVNKAIAPYKQINFYSLGDSIIGGDLIHPSASGYQLMAELASVILLNASEANRPVDTDADGIYDFAEAKFGANPIIADTDGDGLKDGDEVFTYGSDPTLLDSDNDGFGDYQEVVEMGSNPGDPRPGSPVLTEIIVVPPGA